MRGPEQGRFGVSYSVFIFPVLSTPLAAFSSFYLTCYFFERLLFFLTTIPNACHLLFVIVDFRFSFSYFWKLLGIMSSHLLIRLLYASVDLSVGGRVNYFSFQRRRSTMLPFTHNRKLPTSPLEDLVTEWHLEPVRALTLNYRKVTLDLGYSHGQTRMVQTCHFKAPR